MSVTLKFKLNNVEMEASMPPETFLKLLKEGQTSEIGIPVPATTNDNIPQKKVRRERKPKTTEKEQEDSLLQINIPLVSNEQVKQYLLGLPNCKHTLFGVQEHFYGKRFVSRGITKHMYHKTFHQLQEIRAQIEKEKSGKFAMIVGENRINTYVFQNTIEEFLQPTTK